MVNPTEKNQYQNLTRRVTNKIKKFTLSGSLLVAGGWSINRGRWQNEDTLPLYEIPALQTRQYHSHLLQLKLQGEVLNILENVLDATHTHFVHAGLLRHDDQRQSVTATLNVNQVSAEIRYDNEPKQSGWVSSLFEKNRKCSIGRFHLPLIAELEYHIGLLINSIPSRLYICPAF